MYIAGVSGMAFELDGQIGEDTDLRDKVGAFIKMLPEGTKIPGASLVEQARWIIEQAKETQVALMVFAVELALEQIHGEFTDADLVAKVLEAHPDVDRNDLNAAVKSVLRFRDVDFEYHDLLRRADVLSAGLDKLHAGAIAALRRGDENGDYEEAWKLKAEYEAKYAVYARLQAEIQQMYAVIAQT